MLAHNPRGSVPISASVLFGAGIACFGLSFGLLMTKRYAPALVVFVLAVGMFVGAGWLFLDATGLT